MIAKKRYPLFITIIFLLMPYISHSLYSQNKNSTEKNHAYLTARYHYGIVIPHHTSMAYLIEDFSQGYEVTYGRSAYEKDNWEKYFNYPELGVGFLYGTFGNREVYGSGYAFYPYCNFNIYRTKRFTAHYKVSLGIGYTTKPFDRENNIYNSVFGSHFNAYVGFGFMLDYRILSQWSVTTALSINHLSNGGIKKPNNGINTANITIGTKYHFNKNLSPPSKKISAPKDRLNELLIVGFAGKNQGMYFSNDSHLACGLSATHLWHNTQKQAFGVGFDLMYFGGAPYLYFQNEEQDSYSFSDMFYGGPFLAYQKYLGKVIMYFNLGAYLIQGVKPSQPLYPRIGVRYLITNNLIGHFGIKASFFTAEYLEFGLGYRIPFKK